MNKRKNVAKITKGYLENDRIEWFE
jgi:hypothetical protein